MNNLKVNSGVNLELFYSFFSGILLGNPKAIMTEICGSVMTES